jgi:RNA polymerase sigma-70 factor (ECF subfamily)
MKHILTDEELIKQQYLKSPTACFETLYNRYVGKVYSRCLSLIKDAEKAHDFTHDIFIRMFTCLDRFQERSTFSTWLYAISYNYCMDQIKQAKRLPMTNLIPENDSYSSTMDETDQLDYSLQHLSRVLKTISPQEVTLLKLKYQEGLAVHQIAQQLNLKDSAVKMRLKRSRSKVRQLCGISTC